MIAYLSELLNSLKNNKLRTILTGFTIAWGIFILVIMLGSGNGVKNGISTMIISSGIGQSEYMVSLYWTSKPYAGFKEGRRLELTEEQFQYICDKYASETNLIVPFASLFAAINPSEGATYSRIRTMAYEEQAFSSLELISGRLFTKQEQTDGERCIIISNSIATELFKGKGDPIGQSVSLWNMHFKVVGIVKEDNPFFKSSYITLSSYYLAYPNQTISVRDICVYPANPSKKEGEQLMSRIEKDLRSIAKADPTDLRAIHVENSSDSADTMNKLFNILLNLLWVMGIGSLSIGTIGVSNIMYVTIQERMREIGIRKAIGAKPRHILTLVLGESLFLSLISGIVGLLLGIGFIKLLDYLTIINQWGQQAIPMGDKEETIIKLFEHPEVNINIAIGAVIVLVIAGLIAGYGPAKKATKIPAVIAMRDNK